MKKSQKGFTIIEVALVLAIGALIFLVVFLAVPALQRNQRNDARHRDVSNIVNAVASWVGNNTQKNLAVEASGTSPCGDGDQIDQATGAGCPDTPIGDYLDSVSSNTEVVDVIDADAASVPATGSIEAGEDLYLNNGQPTKVTVVVGAQCDGTTNLERGPARSSAVVGSTETTSGAVPYCSSAS